MGSALAITNSSKPVAGFSNLDQQDAWLMTLITQADMVKPGSPVMDEAGLELLLTLYTRTLEQIGKQKFAEAFMRVLEGSSFRPDIKDIRRAAGVDRGIQDPTEQKAMSELRLILAIMRVHGVQMKPLVGRILNDGKDEQGRVLQVPLRTPETRPPTLEPRTEAAIVELGFGSRVAGLEMIAGHPAINKDVDPQFRLKTAADVEKLWIQAYAGVR